MAATFFAIFRQDRVVESVRFSVGALEAHERIVMEMMAAGKATRVDARLTYSAAHLASGTDRWIIAGLQDPTGASGTFIGHALDARTRLWILPGRLQVETGFSAFIFGEFARNVSEGPAGRRTLFGYSQLLLIL